MNNSFDTSKNVSEIVGSLRSKGYQLDMIPSDISGGVRSSFSAVLHGGGGGMLGSRNEPGVKVVIYDSGDNRRVELEALSTSPMGQKFNLKKGEQLCDQLYAELNEGSAADEPQPVITEEQVANDTLIESQKKDDFATKFMKGFKEIDPTDSSAPAVSEPAPESVAVAAPAVAEMPKPDYIKPSTSTDEYSAPSAGDSTWRCEKCGKINVGNSRYCGNCGSQKKEESPSPGPGPNIKIIIIAAAVVLALVVAMSVIGKLSSPPSYDDEYYDDSYDDSSYGEEYYDEYEFGGMHDAIDVQVSSEHEPMGDNYYYPENAVDGDIATAWVEGAEGDGSGEWIYVEFDNTETMGAMRVRNGYQKSDEAFSTNNRIKNALIEFEDGSVEKVTLADRNNAEQIIIFSEEKTGSSLKLTIQSVYPSEDGIDTCITEMGLADPNQEYPDDTPIIYSEKK